MNSIEIAKKLIEENDRDIEDFRRAETATRKRIAEYKHEIDALEKRIESLRAAITFAEAGLKRTRDQKKECLIDNLALKSFIADGGGLDMLD